MKKQMAILLLTIIPMFAMFGQEKKNPNIIYGFGVGLNSSIFSMPDNSQNLEYGKNYERRLGYNLSLRVRAALSNKIHVESGLTYLVKKSAMIGYEFISEKDEYIFVDNQFYGFKGKLSRKSDVIQNSFQIPIQLNIALLAREKYSIEVFGGVFKDFAIKINNSTDIITEVNPKNANNVLNDLMVAKFIETSSGFLSKTYSLFRKLKSDTAGIGFQYGVAAHFQKFGMEVSINRPEDTFSSSAIYQMNAVCINFQYFLK